MNNIYLYIIYSMNLELKINNKFKKLLLYYYIGLFILISFMLLFDIYYTSFYYIFTKNYYTFNLKKHVLYLLLVSPIILYLFYSFYLINKKKYIGYLFIFLILLLFMINVYFIKC